MSPGKDMSGSISRGSLRIEMTPIVTKMSMATIIVTGLRIAN
jgi:hypothetical protein